MRLRQRREFTRLKETGRRLAKGCLIANWQVLPEGSLSRVGVITTRKLGQAAVRSRARRLLRESFRLHRQELTAAVELVLIARSSIVGKTFSQVERDFLAVLQQANLLKRRP
jgi:ribonuclease P protein component